MKCNGVERKAREMPGVEDAESYAILNKCFNFGNLDLWVLSLRSFHLVHWLSVVSFGGQKTLDCLIKALKILIICALLMIQRNTNKRMGSCLVGKIAQRHLEKVLSVWRPPTLCTPHISHDGVAVLKALLTSSKQSSPVISNHRRKASRTSGWQKWWSFFKTEPKHHSG